MPGLIDILSDAENLFAVAPEDLGIVILQLVQQERAPRVTPSNFEMPLWNAGVPAYSQRHRFPVNRALAETTLLVAEITATFSHLLALVFKSSATRPRN
jgi:hypothetical protein